MNTEAENTNDIRPVRECDLVMKGGVTSGIVYPSAVLELKNHYRFRSIGGASAGAVAAAFTAAAEFNREHGGFDKLRSVYGQLQQNDNLRKLFQATPKTQPLLNLVLKLDEFRADLTSISRKDGALARVRAYAHFVRDVLRKSVVPGLWKGRCLGIFIGIILALALEVVVALLRSVLGTVTLGQSGLELVVLGALFATGGYFLGELVAGLRGLYDAAFVGIPRNHFGICSGRSAESGAESSAVTDWTYKSLQAIAGRGAGSKVLTFGDLLEKKINLQNKKIDLRLMTTNLSEKRPYNLPFADPFIFRKDDLVRLFPDDVIDALEAKARKIRGIEIPEHEGYHFLPAPSDLPVAFAARMSMSFPLFFSSVPLYALPLWARRRIALSIRDNPDSELKFAAPHDLPQARKENTDARASTEGEGICKFSVTDLVPQWFSDGGIASNFPIHFFDCWLPDRPTFGITLCYLPDYLRKVNGATNGTLPLDEDEKRALSMYFKSTVDTAPAGKAMSQAHVAGVRWGEDETSGWREHLVSMGGNKRPGFSLGQRVAMRWAKPESTDLDMVELPEPEEDVPPEWRHIQFPGEEYPRAGALPGFLWSVIATMHDFRDDTQAALPGYRERVAQVRLRPNEGGFNLKMSVETIKSVVDKGAAAGAELRDRFSLTHHQWVRLRLLVMELKERFDELYKIRFAQPTGFPARIEEQKDPENGYPFRNPDLEWCGDFKCRVDALHLAIDNWASIDQDVAFPTGEPPPVMRITPKM